MKTLVLPTSTDTSIPWDATVYDTDNFWSAGNPTRFTIPSGVSKVRLKPNFCSLARNEREKWRKG